MIPRLVVFLIVVAISCPALAAVPAERPLPAKLDDAVEKGLAFLARQQQADGSFANDPKDPPEEPKSRTAFTGLSLLAFLSAGHSPDTGRYGITVRSAMDFLVAAVPDDGYIGKVDDGRMYAHAIVTLAMTQGYGVEPDARKRAAEFKKLRKMIEVLLRAQAVDKQPVYSGGWRYQPNDPDSDLSLTGWCCLALRAGQDAGLPVPKEALAKAADFVARCAAKEGGGFGYQPGTPALVSATGSGVLALYLLDRAERRETKEGAARYLMDHPFDKASAYPYYSVYYATQAAWQAGDETWAKVSRETLDRLLNAQSSDGGWPAKTFPDVDPAKIKEPGRVYRTAMAVLTLTVPYRLLPVYQR